MERAPDEGLLGGYGHTETDETCALNDNLLTISSPVLYLETIYFPQPAVGGLSASVEIDPVKINRKTDFKYSFYYKATSFYYKDILTQDQINFGLSQFKPIINKYWPHTLENTNV